MLEQVKAPEPTQTQAQNDMNELPPGSLISFRSDSILISLKALTGCKIIMNHTRAISISMLNIALVMGCTTGSALQKQPYNTTETSPPVVTELNTGYLKATPGYRGDVLGAEIESISIISGGEQQSIKVNVPINPDLVDRVEVISTSGQTVKQNQKAEILRDYETNNVGIKLFLPKRKDLSFRLRLIDVPENE